MSDEEELDRVTLAEELEFACSELEDLSKLRTKSKGKDRRESFMKSVKNVSAWLTTPPPIQRVVQEKEPLTEEARIGLAQLFAEKKHLPKRNKHTIAAVMDNYGYNDFNDIPNREIYEADFHWAQDQPNPSNSFSKDVGSGDTEEFNENIQEEFDLCGKMEKCKPFDDELPLPSAAVPELNQSGTGDLVDPNRSEEMFQEQYKQYAHYARLMNKLEGNQGELDSFEDDEPLPMMQPSPTNYMQKLQHKKYSQSLGPMLDTNEEYWNMNMSSCCASPNPNNSPKPKYPYSSKNIRSMNKHRFVNNASAEPFYNNEPYNNNGSADGYYMAIVKNRSGQKQYTTKVVEKNNYAPTVKNASRQSALTSILTGKDGKLMTGPLAVAMIKEHQKCSNKLFSSLRPGGGDRITQSYLHSPNSYAPNFDGGSGSPQLNPNHPYKIVDALSSPNFSKQPISGVTNVVGSSPMEFTVGVIKHRPIIKKSPVVPMKKNSPNKSSVDDGKGDQTNRKGAAVRKSVSNENSGFGPRKAFSSTTGRKHFTGTTMHMTPETKKYTSARITKPVSKNKTKPETDMRTGNEKVNSLLAKMMSPETAPYSIAPNETKITTKKLKVPNSVGSSRV